MNDKLIKVIEGSIKNSPFYYREFQRYTDIGDFYSNFKLNKNDVINNMYDIISKKYDGNLYKSMQVNTTSGTAGAPVKILWEPNDLIRSNMCVWRYRKKFHDISPNDCYCSLHNMSYLGARTNKLEKVIITNNQISFCKFFQDESTMFEYYNIILKYKPKWLLFQPSFALRFVDFCKQFHLPPVSTIKYIEFTGEMLTDSTRQQIISYFNCSSANMYGCMETNTIAYECPCGTLHVLEDNVAIKVDADKNVYLTSLHNRFFPLINYVVGDKIEGIDHTVCPCGLSGLSITSIMGRATKQIMLKNGKILNESIITYCIERAEAIVGIGLKKYHAVYQDENLVIEVICSNKNVKWLSAFIEEALNQFSVLCDFDNVSFDFVEELNTKYSDDFMSKYSVLEVL